MKRSLSGDTVRVFSRFTVKIGSPAVAAQGRVMRAIRAMNSIAVPKIYRIGRTWYLMETVKSSLGPETGIRKWNWRTAEATMKLYWYMPEKWFYPDAPDFNPQLLVLYIEDRGWLNKIPVPPIKFLWSKYGSANLLTHGDLTNENTVIDLKGRYQLLDWQAMRHPHIPAHRDVDYGKLVQSLMGWTDVALRTEENAWEIREIMNTSPLSIFWAAIHFMRIEARSTSPQQKDLCVQQIEYLGWLMEKEQVA